MKFSSVFVKPLAPRGLMDAPLFQQIRTKELSFCNKLKFPNPIIFAT